MLEGRIENSRTIKIS
ncbi:unnamed protein product, partial [Adineta steineri]